MRILLILTTLFFFSCSSDYDKQINESSNKELSNKDTATLIKNNNTKIITDSIIYQSEPNGLAEIRLTIIPNGEFEYFMQTISQPMSNDDDEVIISSYGKWTKKDNWIELVFEKNKPELNAVFDINYADSNQFKVIDTNTVKININRNSIYIWGINCQKESLNQPIGTNYNSKIKIQEYFIKETGAFNNQTISEDCIVLIYPTDQQIAESKEEIGEEDFYIIADDNNFYMSNLIEFMKKINVTTITSNKRILKFIGNSEDYIVNLDKQNAPKLASWNAILFNKNREPIFIDIANFDEEYIVYYMK